MRVPVPVATAQVDARSESVLLAPYLPRLVVEWAREKPEARYAELDSSVAFVDISGFTQLTEQLARKGKVGAEEMSDALDACFTDLLAGAYAEGAGLLKWGGDAVLLLFAHDDHAPRACRAAVAMQQRITAIGKIRAPGKPVTLRMSVGIHTGTFQFFLVGAVHRELIVAGPATTTVVAMEKAAEAGEVVVSDATASAIDSRLLGERRGAGVLLAAAPALPRLPPPAVDIAGLDLAPYLPLGVREYVLAERREPEHRLITIAFIEFTGTDDLLATEGVEGVAHALHECISRIQRAAHRYGVTFLESDISSNGGKVLLIAGAPATSGNDEERMLRTVRAIIDDAGRLPLRVGVNSGRVFAGDFGPPHRRTFSVKGDAVNLAARVMGKAVAGQALATRDVLSRSRRTFVAEPLEPFAVKGKSMHVQAFAVGAPVDAQTNAAAAVPLVGRERELQTLLEALASAREWQGRTVEVVGEAGLGKSRLVEELGSRAPDVEVLKTSCEEYELSTPYFPFRALLRRALRLEGDNRAQLGRQLRRRVEEVAPELLAWVPLVAVAVDAEVPPTREVEELDERFRRLRLEEATRDLLGIALARPTLIVFEDVHWMDDASADLLRQLVQEIGLRPWAVLTTRRDGPGGFAGFPEGWERLDLEPLGVGEAVALAELATDESPLPPHELAALAARSSGNPLFLGELVAAARRSDVIDALPDSVEGLLAAEIDQLTPADRIVLRSASVLGVHFGRDLLETVLESHARPEDESVWRRLSGLLVYSDGEVQFRHALVRDAAYEGLPFRRRRELHARVAETIEVRAEGRSDEVAEVLSLHFFSAGRLDKAWHYSRLAGDGAKAIYANAEAAAFYERALTAAARLRSVPATELAATAEALGDVFVRLGAFARAGSAYRRSRRRVRDEPVEQARLMLKAALVPWRLGRFPSALRWIRRGLRALEGRDDPASTAQRARLYAWHAVIRQKQGRSLEAVELCRRAIAEAQRAGAADALAHAYYVLDWAYVSLGRLDDAVYSPRALALYEELGDIERQAAVLNNMGAWAYFRSHWDEALDLYERARQAWEKVGDRWSASFPAANRGEILADQGRLDEAEPLFRDAYRVARASNTSSFLAETASWLGRLAARRGTFDEAHALLTEARERYAADGERESVVVTDARIAECFLLEGDGEQALATANEALARAAAGASAAVVAPMLHRVAGSALLQLGRFDEAGEALAESLREARRTNADFEVALTLDALATLRRLAGEDATALERERGAILDRLGVMATPTVPLPARRRRAAS